MDLGEIMKLSRIGKGFLPYHLQTPVARNDFTISKYKLTLRDIME
jgi:hypothetical protein